ncbi:TadE/TadG family type IV pilus assembly protein [Neptunicoccus sediminis]|uniref:TadE/TadG family type IV pilus assembly protein n=1 Tax=Neptunicoccus sediminis TaxID=1892596 RepID=UPI00084621C2|nr:hypothetical protein [Neptunicoccus sediminis]
MRLLKRLTNRLNALKRDESGATMVEFMFILPLVAFWFAGTFTFFDAYSTWTRSVKATYTVADILSRQTEVDDQYIKDMNTLFASIMGVDSSDTYMRISNIDNTEDGLEIDWSVGTGTYPALTRNKDIPHEIFPNLQVGESTILIESHIPFVPFQEYIGIEARLLVKKLVMSPRFTSKLANSDHSSG